MSSFREGGCQCGGIRYRVTADPIMVGICHCGQCQKQSGSAFGMSFIVRRDAFALLCGQPKTFTRSSDSGRPVVCAFCPDCGTRIYHETSWYSSDVVNIKPGTFDDTGFLRPSGQLWDANRQPWLPPFPDLRTFEMQPPSNPRAPGD